MLKDILNMHMSECKWILGKKDKCKDCYAFVAYNVICKWNAMQKIELIETNVYNEMYCI